MSPRLLLLALALAATAQAVVKLGRPDSWIYGINDAGEIVEWNPVLEQYGVFAETGQVFNIPPGAAPNGFSYDRARDIMIWVFQQSTAGGPRSGVYYWIRNDNEFARFAEPCAIGWRGGSSLPACTDEATAILPADATFYQDSYWYIPRRDTGPTQPCYLVKAPVLYTNNVPSGFGAYTKYLLSGCPNQLEFGDIASDYDTGIIYGATFTPLGSFFSIDTNNLALPPANNTYNLIAPTGTNPSLQIAFNCDWTVLYGVEYQGGGWYAFDLTTGKATQIDWNPNPFGPRDLAGGSCAPLPPDPDGPGTIAPTPAPTPAPTTPTAPTVPSPTPPTPAPSALPPLPNPPEEPCPNITKIHVRLPKKVKPGKKFPVTLGFALPKGVANDFAPGTELYAVIVLPENVTLVKAFKRGVYRPEANLVYWPVPLPAPGSKKAQRALFFFFTVLAKVEPGASLPLSQFYFYIVINNPDGTLNCITQITGNLTVAAKPYKGKTGAKPHKIV